ncbi:MAG: ABC transporter, partial [Cyanobacteria bacterium 13_1_20CM_4_61_6]
ALGALVVLDPVLALSVAVVFGGGIAASLAVGRPLRERIRRARRRRTRLAANVAEQVTGLGVVQAFGQLTHERTQMERQSRSLTRAMIRRARALGQLSGLSEAGAILAPAAVLLTGSEEIHAGRATAGTVVAAMTIASLVATATRDLGRVPEYWNGSRVALEKARAFLATPTLAPERPGAQPLPVGEGRLAFADAGLDGALEHIDVAAEPGAVVAVTGENGAGKSTLLALAARLADPDSGSVLLDGHDLRDVRLTSLRRAIGIAGPDLPLRRGDLEHNLRYRWPGAPASELDRVVRLTGLQETLKALPAGLETRVAERGSGLSSGQRARVELARAIVGDPRLLLLDEVDAHLDAEAKLAVDRILDDRRGRLTTVIVTHRREVIERADVVWHL